MNFGRLQRNRFTTTLIRRFYSNLAAAKKTCLYDFHLRNGGKIVEFAGFAMPTQYSDLSVSDSVLHTRSRVSLFDVSHMLQTKIYGTHCEDFVESLTPADLQNLDINSGTLTVFTNPEGGIIDDLIVSKIDDSSFYMVTNAGRIDVDLPHMEKNASEWRQNGKDVRVEVLSNRALIAIQGPEMIKLLGSETDVPLKELYFMHTAVGSVCGIENCRVTRCGYTGEDGVEVSVPIESVELFAHRLMTSKAAEAKLAGLGARDVLRIEAGLCLYGSDIDEGTTPVEAGLTFVIAKRRRQTLGFPGADKIVGQIEKKSADRKRIGLAATKGGRAPRAHMPVVKLTSNSRVGTISSGCPSPTLGKCVAMGYVEKNSAKLGTILAVETAAGKTNEVEVVKMPFVPSKYYTKPTTEKKKMGKE